MQPSQLQVSRTTTNASTLVELLRWRALQQPERRIYTYLVDGEIEGANLNFAALDRQAHAIGAMLQSYRASGERALIAWTGKHKLLVQCSKATEQAGSVPYCSIQRVLSSSLPFLDAYMPGLLQSLCRRRIWPSRNGLCR